MKSISILFLCVFTIPALATEITTVSSRDKASVGPALYQALESKVLGSVKNFKSFDQDIGEVISWTCQLKDSKVGDCTVVLDLPKGWDYSGCFKLNLNYDQKGSVYALHYDWSQNGCE